MVTSVELSIHVHFRCHRCCTARGSQATSGAGMSTQPGTDESKIGSDTMAVEADKANVVAPMGGSAGASALTSFSAAGASTQMSQVPAPPTSLVQHEGASGAVQHGAPTGAEGKVTTTLTYSTLGLARGMANCSLHWVSWPRWRRGRCSRTPPPTAP